MRAVVVSGKGGVDVMSVASDVPLPTLKGPNDVLFRVHATSVNRLDLMQRKGVAPVPPGASEILGVEAAGEVVAVGESVTMWKAGDRIMCLLSGGGYAEYTVVHEGSCLPVPERMSFTEAAATVETFLTAFQSLRINANTQRGDKVLIHAGASGVGTAAAQLCKHVIGAVSVTTSSEGKVAECAKFADHAVSRTKDEATGSIFAAKVAAAVGANQINVVIDPVFGGGYLQEDAEVIAPDGRIVILAFMGGAAIPDFNAMSLFRKRADLKFSTLRSQPAAYKANLVARFKAEAYDALVAGTIGPVVQHVLPLAEVQKAHTLLEENNTVGKVVMTLA